ncbi:uncharacterized protein Gasu_20380 [Galdieria sulphuraria]|uniref:Dolichol-phosphate mannosyltransferase subunit 3 n=1 Tax=Galdieria sulphuraria TaxID=130081 RepID=M2W494_GALSU|nr:uncharacterized protein Gasu_20380 [Galdieria sulphuraria]EME30576.1 hypothetical protein Gasu_20380 [Galdieria sulphuraria]|eukprot:XP_005707096.1 hypothetical protein Gasu_20380 [Galdieria sulphuraria]
MEIGYEPRGLQQVLYIAGSLFVAVFLYFVLRILYGLSTFPDRPDAFAELEKDLAKAKKFLRSKGVEV